MEADSNMGFPPGGAAPASLYNRHMVSFQSGAMNASAGMAPEAAGMFNPGTMMLPAGISASAVILEPVPGLRRDTGLAADWTLEEQNKLREGLIKYAGEPSIMKYIKIANLLRDKTVRDVALRCRWMTKKEYGKRRKPEEHYVGKKLKDRREKMMDSYLKENLHTVNSENMAPYSLMMYHVNHNDQFACEAPALDGPTQNLMDENEQVFKKIAENLVTVKIQDNVNLFCRTRNNIATILNSMSEMPGIMSQMPPLPISTDDQLLSSILPGIYVCACTWWHSFEAGAKMLTAYYRTSSDSGYASAIFSNYAIIWEIPSCCTKIY